MTERFSDAVCLSFPVWHITVRYSPHCHPIDAYSSIGDIRLAIIKSGAVSQLTNMLINEDMQLQESVVASLAELSHHGLSSLSPLKEDANYSTDDTHSAFEARAVQELAGTLKSDNLGIRCLSASCLSHLAKYSLLSCSLCSHLNLTISQRTIELLFVSWA